MKTKDSEYSNYGLFSIGLGILVGTLSVILPISLPRVLNVLAIIQTTLLSIVVAIYILGNQIILERYSPRVLEINPDSKIYSILALFGCSIIVDVVSLLFLPFITRYTVLIFVVVGVVFSLASGVFFTLLQIKDEMIGDAQLESISEVIRESISENAFRDFIDSNDDSRPFYDQFEVTRNALRNDDRQDAREILKALTNSFKEISESVFSESSSNSKAITLRFLQIIDEFSKIGTLAVDCEDKQLIDSTVEIQRDIGVSAVKANFDHVSSQAVTVIHSISEEIIPEKIEETPAKSTWLSYGRILETAAEKDTMRTIGSTTNSISLLLMDIQEESAFLDPRADNVAKTLIQTLLDGWNTYLENHGESVPVSEIGYGDPKYMTPDLLEYKHSFNHFEENFQSSSRSIFRIRTSDLGETRTIEIEQTIIQGLKQLAITSAEIKNEGLAYHFSMVLVFIGLQLGLDSPHIPLASSIKEIKDTNTTGANAVKYMFTELRKFPDQNGPQPVLYIGTAAREFYDNEGKFMDQLMKLELEVYQ